MDGAFNQINFWVVIIIRLLTYVE